MAWDPSFYGMFLRHFFSNMGGGGRLNCYQERFVQFFLGDHLCSKKGGNINSFGQDAGMDLVQFHLFMYMAMPQRFWAHKIRQNWNIANGNSASAKK